LEDHISPERPRTPLNRVEEECDEDVIPLAWAESLAVSAGPDIASAAWLTLNPD